MRVAALLVAIIALVLAPQSASAGSDALDAQLSSGHASFVDE